jgi:hypothetical protein
MTDQNPKVPAPERAATAPVELPATPVEPNAPLFHEDEGRGFRARWEGIQTGFVDEPRTAVEQADALVSEIMKRLSDVFAEERASLEQHWGRGENVSTEDLRIALKRYRSFFERLLHV